MLVLAAGMATAGVAVAGEQPAQPPTDLRLADHDDPSASPSPSEKEEGKVTKVGKGCEIEYSDRIVFVSPVPGGEVDCEKANKEKPE